MSVVVLKGGTCSAHNCRMRVRAINAYGSNSYSSWRNVHTYDKPDAAVVTRGATPPGSSSTNMIVVEWAAPEDHNAVIDKYEIMIDDIAKPLRPLVLEDYKRGRAYLEPQPALVRLGSGAANAPVEVLHLAPKRVNSLGLELPSGPMRHEEMVLVEALWRLPDADLLYRRRRVERCRHRTPLEHDRMILTPSDRQAAGRRVRCLARALAERRSGVGVVLRHGGRVLRERAREPVQEREKVWLGAVEVLLQAEHALLDRID